MYYKLLPGTLTLPNGTIINLPPDNFVEVTEDPDDFWSPVIGQRYDLGKTYTEIGNYVLNIPEGMFFTNESGNDINPAWTVIWSIGNNGIAEIFNDAKSFDVYSIGGAVLIKNGTAAQLNSLPSGIYIINNKKTIINR